MEEGSSNSSSDSSSDDDDDEEEEDNDDPVVKQAKLVNHMLSAQKSIAEEIMNDNQLQVYRPLIRKVEEASTMQAKQAAMKEAKQVWHPLLSSEQATQMESKMKESMAAFLAGK